MRALEQIVSLLCVCHVLMLTYLNQFYQEGRTDLINELGKDWISTSEMTKDNLVAQLALGQDDGKTFGKLYGDGKNT